MTTPQHVKRMREATNAGVCNSVSCACPTCGVIDKLIQGALAGSHPVERYVINAMLRHKLAKSGLDLLPEGPALIMRALGFILPPPSRW